MAGDEIITDQAVTPATSPERKLREVIADAYTFVRSMEANKALATVTLEQLMSDQIQRNGESARSNSAQYDPYSYDPSKPEPKGGTPEERVNFLGGADTTQPTKLDRILAIKNNLSAVVQQITNMQPVEVADAAEYVSTAEYTS